GKREDHRGYVGCQRRRAPQWRRIRARLRTAMAENEERDEYECRPGSNPIFDEEEPALIERDPIGAAPDREHGRDGSSDEDGGPPPHGDVESKKGEPARIEVRGVRGQQVHDEQEKQWDHEPATKGMGEYEHGVTPRTEGGRQQDPDRLDPDAGHGHPEKRGNE